MLGSKDTKQSSQTTRNLLHRSVSTLGNRPKSSSFTTKQEDKTLIKFKEKFEHIFKKLSTFEETHLKILNNILPDSKIEEIYAFCGEPLNSRQKSIEWMVDLLSKAKPIVLQNVILKFIENEFQFCKASLYDLNESKFLRESNRPSKSLVVLLLKQSKSYHNIIKNLKTTLENDKLKDEDKKIAFQGITLQFLTAALPPEVLVTYQCILTKIEALHAKETSLVNNIEKLFFANVVFIFSSLINKTFALELTQKYNQNFKKTYLENCPIENILSFYYTFQTQIGFLGIGKEKIPNETSITTTSTSMETTTTIINQEITLNPKSEADETPSTSSKVDTSELDELLADLSIPTSQSTPTSPLVSTSKSRPHSTLFKKSTTALDLSSNEEKSEEKPQITSNPTFIRIRGSVKNLFTQNNSYSKPSNEKS
jgi:hypothetical protein